MTITDNPQMALWRMRFDIPVVPACTKGACYCENPHTCGWPHCKHANTYPRIVNAHKTVYEDIYVTPERYHPLSGISEYYRTIPVDMLLESCLLTICSDCERLVLATWIPRGMYEVHV